MTPFSSESPLRRALRACRTHFMFVGLFSGLVNVLYLIPSVFMLQVYDRVVPTRGVPTLVVLTLILAVSLIVFAMLDSVRMRLLMRSSMRLEKMAAENILHRILGAGNISLAQRMQATRDFDTLRGTLTGPAMIALFDAPWAPIYILVCFLLHPAIGAFALLSVALLVGIAVMSDLMTRKSVSEASRRSTASYQLQDYSIQSAEVARALGMRRAMVARHLKDRSDVAQLQGEAAEVSGQFLAVTKFLRMLFQSLALAIGAYLAVNQKISAGAIFAASLVLGRALQPVEQILGALKNVLAAQEAYRNLERFCDLPTDLTPKTALPTPLGLIEVANLTVYAAGGDQTILSDMTFAIKPGEVIAVVGPSGAGKSTLLRVLAGALELDSGEVRIDGARLADWDREELGRHIGYMPQSPTLFPGTVHANISRFRRYLEPASEDMDQRIVSAAKLAGAHEVILRFSNGYDTQLGARDAGVSAGQQQMVALARAMFDAPRIVLLDEPNAHLDSRGEAALITAITELKRMGVTVVISSHRTGVLHVVDKVMVIQEGRIHVFTEKEDLMRPQNQVAPDRPADADEPTGPKPLSSGGVDPAERNADAGAEE